MSYILVIEDDPTQAQIYRRELEAAGYNAMIASDLETAENCFRRYHQDIIAMIIDGAVPANLDDWEGASNLTTIPFITEVKSRGFTGLMVAASTREDYRNCMVQAGCSQGLPKCEAAASVIGWLQSK